ncbi:MAG: hypothetical protein Q9209_006507 [Squamulea sp. 1 TL-2023]
MQPAPGGDTSTGPSILTVTWLFTGISTIIVGLKIWTRLKIIQQFGADDILTILALLFLLASAPLVTVSVCRGLGRHIYYLSLEARMQCSKLAILSSPLVFLAGTWPNISVAIALNRIFVPQPWQLGFLYGVPILQCVFAMISSIVTYTICSPLEGLWDLRIGHKCLSSHVIVDILYANGDAIHRILNWAIIEAAFIIIAACIPSLRPFVRVLGKSLHIDSARSLFIPKGYYHAHSRRHRPQPLVPRDSGSGATGWVPGTIETPSPWDKYGRDEGRDVEEGVEDIAGLTPPSTAATAESFDKEEVSGRSQV